MRLRRAIYICVYVCARVRVFYLSRSQAAVRAFFVDAARCLPPGTRLPCINNANARQDCM